MKEYTGSKLIVLEPKNQCELVIHVDDYATIDEVRKAIDHENAHAVEQGYTAKQWLICKREFHSVYEDNGQFVSSEMRTVGLELYPC